MNIRNLVLLSAVLFVLILSSVNKLYIPNLCVYVRSSKYQSLTLACVHHGGKHSFYLHVCTSGAAIYGRDDVGCNDIGI